MAHCAAKRRSPDLVRPNMGISSDGDRLHSFGTKMAERNMTNLNVVLLGRTGVGKSASGNTILGREAFKSNKSSTSVTRDVAVGSAIVNGFSVTVYDTPGFFGKESEEELRIYEEGLPKCGSGLCVFLIVLRSDRFTPEDQEHVEKIEELLGEKHFVNTWILFTRGDKLEEENKSIDQLISEAEFLKKLTQKYEGRFHVFNNKTKGESVQVKSLTDKVFQMNQGNASKRQSIPISIQETPVSSPSSRRIVLLGKSGVGKSAAGNTILGQRAFKSVTSMFTVTHESSAAHATVSGRSVSVVDTPGLFDTQMRREELKREIARSVYLSSPGPHAFLTVFPLNMRITEEDRKTTEQIKTLFGEEVLKYSIVLFTYGDLLDDESVEDLIEENSRLRDLVGQCGGRYHVFNNRDLNNRDQVNDLLKKIDTMIEENGGGHYSHQMYEDAQRFRREEEERRQQEKQAEIVRIIKQFGAELEVRTRSKIERHKAKIQNEPEGARVKFIHFCPSIRVTLNDDHWSWIWK